MSAPTLEEVINLLIDVKLDDVNVSMPGRITAYDRATSTASVQPLVKRASIVDGERVVETRPVIPNVPVTVDGGGAYRTTYPVAVGDDVLLVISSQALDRWWRSGRIDDPGIDRRHNLTDAIAIKGLRSRGRALTRNPDDRMSVGHDTGASIGITEAAVRLGNEEATDPVMLRSDGVALQTALTDALAALGMSPATNAQAIAALTALQTALGAPWPVAATKVFAE